MWHRFTVTLNNFDLTVIADILDTVAFMVLKLDTKGSGSKASDFFLPVTDY
jgi:hypothetical protein